MLNPLASCQVHLLRHCSGLGLLCKHQLRASLRRREPALELQEKTSTIERQPYLAAGLLLNCAPCPLRLQC